MKKVLIFIIVIIALGAGYWFIAPFFIDKKVSEVSPILNTNQQIGESSNTNNVLENNTSNLPEVVATGNFTGFDKVHYGSGSASLIKTDTGYTIRFEDDFNVANGPDLYVGFGKDGKYIKGSEISKLKGNIGSQNYVLPANFNIDEYNEVWVWCKAFAVPFAKVELK